MDTMTKDDYARMLLKGQIDVDEDDEPADDTDQLPLILDKITSVLAAMADRPEPTPQIIEYHAPTTNTQKRKFEFTFKRDRNGFLTGVTATEE